MPTVEISVFILQSFAFLSCLVNFNLVVHFEYLVFLSMDGKCLHLTSYIALSVLSGFPGMKEVLMLFQWIVFWATVEGAIQLWQKFQCNTCVKTPCISSYPPVIFNTFSEIKIGSSLLMFTSLYLLIWTRISLCGQQYVTWGRIEQSCFCPAEERSAYTLCKFITTLCYSVSSTWWILLEFWLICPTYTNIHCVYSV